MLGHCTPQAPHEVGARRSASQPSAGLALQSAKPRSHATPQAPATHDLEPFGRAGQTVPQTPQWSGLVATTAHSIPQRAWVAEHPLSQTLESPRVEQRGVAPEQRFPQAPQLATAVRSASQPFVGLPSQSAKPRAQLTPQRPARQVAADCGPAGQAVPQAPQWDSLVAVLTQVAPQQASEPVHPLEHDAPPAAIASHTGVDPLHRVAQAPQLVASVRSASQPFVASPSQFAAPLAQAIPQTPPTHLGVARTPTGQTVPQAPQFCRSTAVSTVARQDVDTMIGILGQSRTEVANTERRPLGRARDRLRTLTPP